MAYRLTGLGDLSTERLIKIFQALPDNQEGVEIDADTHVRLRAAAFSWGLTDHLPSEVDSLRWGSHEIAIVQEDTEMKKLPVYVVRTNFGELVGVFTTPDMVPTHLRDEDSMREATALLVKGQVFLLAEPNEIELNVDLNDKRLRIRQRVAAQLSPEERQACGLAS